VCAAQAIPDLSRLGVIDAEIAEKGHLWTETSYHCALFISSFTYIEF